jgi:hypothetical protein
METQEFCIQGHMIGQPRHPLCFESAYSNPGVKTMNLPKTIACFASLALVACGPLEEATSAPAPQNESASVPAADPEAEELGQTEGALECVDVVSHSYAWGEHTWQLMPRCGINPVVKISISGFPDTECKRLIYYPTTFRKWTGVKWINWSVVRC